ncbi:Homeobox-leucine zipper protein ROC2 [Apostasia shenzhenica]|uniref:Homeobox-leucine zipper protein ROC2 n=1 Tax=Apostasia shenzhenica TaxID=1088818 RepID=A0A2I0AQI6_9ASPA|nr:Homeobox-leucine zipper protein ROC2 [Apostasia shenzhenica]
MKEGQEQQGFAHEERELQELAESNGFSDIYLQLGIEENPNPNPNPNPNNPSANKRKRPSRRKSYLRHTDDQIQFMEEVFKVCQHPDDMMRIEMSQTLGLKPMQIKFWFQNKRTQIKNQQERMENQRLRSENERLRFENSKYVEALKCVVCPNCTATPFMDTLSPKSHILLQNNQLKREIMRMLAVAAQRRQSMASSSSLSMDRQEVAGVGGFPAVGGMVMGAGGSDAATFIGETGASVVTDYGAHAGSGAGGWPGDPALGMGGSKTGNAY